MSAEITVHVAGSERAVPVTTTAADLFEGRREVVVARINGELADLAYVLSDGDTVEPVTIDSEDGLNVLRHSCAHVLAQAVQQAHPDAKLGIGPPIRDGFYYDFDVAEPFTPEDLKALERSMQRIVNEGQTFVRREVSDEEARAELAGEPYKLRAHRPQGRRVAGRRRRRERRGGRCPADHLRQRAQGRDRRLERPLPRVRTCRPPSSSATPSS
jgi:threonyl-tRNA synthetase